MCFSATASFVASGVLVTAGAITVNKARKNDKDYLLLSALPIGFGVQQFSEGMVWTGLDSGNADLIKWASFSFLFWAFMFWPIYVPNAILKISRNQQHYRKIIYLALLGTLLGCLIYLPLLIGTSNVSTSVYGHSIRYVTDRPVFYKAILTTGYIFVVVTSFFLSKLKKLKIFGMILMMTIVGTFAIEAKTFFSVWCFFAAILSMGTYFLIPAQPKLKEGLAP